MKKIVQAATFFCFGIHALDYHIENKTGGQIEILLEYEGAILCGPSARIIDEDKKVVVKSRLCRAGRITINGQIYNLILPKVTSQEQDKVYELIITNQNSPDGKAQYSIAASIADQK